MKTDSQPENELPWTEEAIAQLEDNVHRLEEQVLAQTSQIRRLEEQIEDLDVALTEARRQLQNMNRSLVWRLTRPLRLVQDVAVANLTKVWRRVNLSLPAAKLGLNSHAIQLAALIRESGLFDVSAYEGAAEARAQGLDPALHYVLVGEGRRLKPSPAFDPIYYAERYPDLAAWGGNLLEHYLKTGRAEGRRPVPFTDRFTLPLAPIKADRPMVLVLIHAASQTGAPILGWNITRRLSSRVNVVAILLREGPLEQAFHDITAAVVGPIGDEIFHSAEASRLASRLVAVYQPFYAVANSVETRALAVALADQGIPVVALAHEFSGYIKPAGTLRLLYERAAEIVFPAEVVKHSSEIDYPFLRLRQTHVLPQGGSDVPASGVTASNPKAETEPTIRRKLRPDEASNDLVVVGMGFVDWRKGVDLFIATAAAILARDPEASVRFIWVGNGYRVVDAVNVSCYLSEQVMRSRLGNRFEFMDAVDDVESIYEEADVLFLSSRLDPLPNVSIDATLRGIPVVCFAEASGMAEILSSNDETRALVVPHLDVGAAAMLINSLAADRDKLRRLSDAVRQLARARFDMSAYVAALDKLGRCAVQTVKREEADAALILDSNAFDAPLYLGERTPFVKLAAAVREYSSLANRFNYARVPGVHQACTRRPLAGFHPVTYAVQNPTYDAQTGGDPLAHYLRSGRPKGPWVHPVLRIESPKQETQLLPMPKPSPLRVVLHGHFHHTDHFGDFLRALAANAQPCELILTTTSIEKAAEIKATLKRNRAEADVRVTPNRGRDIAPFLMVLKEAMGRCDLLGHIHGKRSAHVEKHFIDSWRTFLWQHLVGDEMPMIDIISQAFTEDPALGLIFPEDPFLVGWEKNLSFAQDLATRMGLHAPLPLTMESPVGMMFWARPEALAPLLRLNFSWGDYPPEPLPGDGTMLHALERLLALVAEDAGYHYATTYLPRFVR
jgi:glycosyltransferase involved in cell wall biosynthesis